MIYYNVTNGTGSLVNATGINELLVFDNAVSGGIFTWMILVGVWGVMFLTYKNHPIAVSMQIASLAMLVTSIFFMVPGLTTWLHIGVSMFALICAIAYSFMAQQP